MSEADFKHADQDEALAIHLAMGIRALYCARLSAERLVAAGKMEPAVIDEIRDAWLGAMDTGEDIARRRSDLAEVWRRWVAQHAAIDAEEFLVRNFDVRCQSPIRFNLAQGEPGA